MKNRFEDAGDIIIDHITGKEWEPECSGPMDWYDAIYYAENLVLHEKNDWRIPTRWEMEGLLSVWKINPASEFPDMYPGRFITSSLYAGGASSIWYVDFIVGKVYYADKSYSSYLMCVRGKGKSEK